MFTAAILKIPPPTVQNCCFRMSLVADINISQGSVARCGGIFKYDYVANVLVSLIVKEFRKSVNIWRSYMQEYTDSLCNVKEKKEKNEEGST